MSSFGKRPAERWIDQRYGTRDDSYQPASGNQTYLHSLEFLRAKASFPSSNSSPNLGAASVSEPIESQSDFNFDPNLTSDLFAEIASVRRALDLFLDSRMNDAESLLLKGYGTSLYFTLGYGVLSCFRALLTFHQDDLDTAMKAFNNTINLANSMRKKDSIFGSVTSLVRGGPSIRHLKSMTPRQRHAELVFAESHMFMAILCVIRDEGIWGLLREGFYVRQSYSTYRSLQKFLDVVEAEAEKGVDISHYQIDYHFTSGVALGIGIFNVILSFFPTRLLKLLEIVGFSGDRVLGLATLEAIGGWTHDPKDIPDTPAPCDPMASQGIRRQFCDIMLLVFHLIVSGFVTNSHFDLTIAIKITNFNIELYPNSVIFMYFAGKIHQFRHNIPAAIQHYEFSIHKQKEWKQLHHVCYWELFVCYSSMQDWRNALYTIDVLAKESLWTKSIYSYHKAIAMYMLGREEDKEQIVQIMENVPSLLQKFSGKSIPSEKFVARKARKFIEQGNRLFLPGYEYLYMWNCYDFMGVDELHQALEVVSRELARLEVIREQGIIPETSKPGSPRKLRARRLSISSTLSEKSSRSRSTTPSKVQTEDSSVYINFWDDFCLGYFLQGVIASRLAFLPRSNTMTPPPYEAYYHLALNAFNTALAHAPKIHYDHYVAYYARYELGRTYMCLGKLELARLEYEKVLHSNHRPTGRGKFSLHGTLLFKLHTALLELDLLRDEKLSVFTGETSMTESLSGQSFGPDEILNEEVSCEKLSPLSPPPPKELRKKHRRLPYQNYWSQIVGQERDGAPQMEVTDYATMQRRQQK
ncbi:uncharacterized protein VTP21DRAFT_475 [Calcarisporiella thermophila]|uniref:uncharacterized protein n=1 Tax=Calcarisporiella thermophila TaxID=911321 RepID=UPI0037425248